MPEIFIREIELRAAEADGDLIPCVLSTEQPVDRGGYDEVLSHQSGEVDLSRAPLPVVVQHDHTRLNVGVVEQVRIEGRKLTGLARFGASTQAREILADVKSGIIRSLSVGYQLLKTISETGRTVRFAWMPYEVSVVSVPADLNAGFYRSMTDPSKGKHMTDITITDKEHGSRSQRRSANQAIIDERERIEDITALGRQQNLVKEADDAVRSGVTLDTFRKFVLDQMQGRGPIRIADSFDIGLSSREIERFSFVKAILAQTDPDYARREAGFELEASRAMAQQLRKDPRGIFIPGEVLRYQSRAQRDLVAGTPGLGGNLVGTELQSANFISLLRNRSHVINLGAMTVGDLVGNVDIPAQTGAANAFWVAEGGAPTETSQTFGQVPLTPKTVGAFTDFTRRMLKQATPDIEMIVRADLAGIIGVEMDRVALAGSGTSNEPLGILNAVGIGSVPIATNGGAITWNHVLQLEEAIANANADDGALGYMTNNKVRRALKGSTKVSGDAGAGFIWSDEARDADGYGSLNGYRAAASNNVPSNLIKGSGTNLSAMIFGNWADVIIGQWGGLDILVDKFTNSTSGGTRVVAFLDMDIAIRRVASFAAIKDAVT